MNWLPHRYDSRLPACLECPFPQEHPIHLELGDFLRSWGKQKIVRYRRAVDLAAWCGGLLFLFHLAGRFLGWIFGGL